MPVRSADDSLNPAQAVVARQAIVDASRNVVAYELLYRRTETAPTAQALDGERATLDQQTAALIGDTQALRDWR